jgi:hypothetical protein
LAAERADATALRRLRREVRRLPETEFLTLMVELMELDTTKHVRILEFLRAGAPAARRHVRAR